jgi:hypothetical protein
METVRIEGSDVRVYGDPWRAQKTIDEIRRAFDGTALYHRGEPHNDRLDVAQRLERMKEIFEV